VATHVLHAIIPEDPARPSPLLLLRGHYHVVQARYRDDIAVLEVNGDASDCIFSVSLDAYPEDGIDVIRVDDEVAGDEYMSCVPTYPPGPMSCPSVHVPAYRVAGRCAVTSGAVTGVKLTELKPEILMESPIEK
jgi:hypothetical protein